MGNLALHSAEEPDNLRATTGTVEIHTERANDAALVLGARPIIQHQPAARHSHTIRYDTRCYFNDISQLNLPHGTDN